MPTSSYDVLLGRARTIHAALDCYARVEVRRPLPCLAIVVHGVHDVGTTYPAHEAGLCAGLNARLNRSSSTERPGGDLHPADYRLDDARAVAEAKARDPRLAARLRADPDATMYRRAGSLEAEGTYSPDIPRTSAAR